MNRRQRRSETTGRPSAAKPVAAPPSNAPPVGAPPVDAPPVDAPPVGAVFAEALRQHQAGRLDHAERLYRQALHLAPRHADSLHLLGVVAHQTGRHDLAASLIGRAIALDATAASYHFNLGAARRAQRRLDEAVACYRRALALQPGFAAAHYNLGLALAAQQRPAEAAAAYRQALELQPDFAEAHTNLGAALRDLARPEEAAACYRRALALRPDDPQAHYNLGIALGEQRRLEEAVACYRRAIALRPDHAEAHNNLARALLALGELEAGWVEYEWRWKTEPMCREQRGFAQPQWRGEPMPGQRLLVHAEQGFGDALQFCRFVPLAAARGLRVTLETPRSLVRLFGGLPGVERVVARGERLPEFDLHCPMLSLPLALSATPATIPAGSYLHADPMAAAAWRSRLELPGLGSGRLVGLAWAGNAGLAADRRRSIDPQRLTPLLAVPGLRFVSLQKSGPAAPAGWKLADFMAGMVDFADTAALVANLDLVISVDTAVAHLAAALGRPVWVLDRFDPCWRWLEGRRDSPWYPTLRLFRQARPDDWEPVVAELAGELQRFAEAGPAQPDPPTG